MKNGLNWTYLATYQNKYLNRKPSPANTYTVRVNYAGVTREELISRLEKELGQVRYPGTKFNQKLLSYTEPVEY